VLAGDVMSNHSTPDIGSRCPWTPKHLSASVSAAHLYTMPATGSVHTASDLDEGLSGCVASMPPSLIDVAGPQASTLTASGAAPLAMLALAVVLDQRVPGPGARPSETLGTPRQSKAVALCGGSVPTAVHEEDRS
jgi:hypothetical protein